LPKRDWREFLKASTLSPRTIRYHMAEIMDRLHLEHRSQVIAYAGKMGLEPEGQGGCPPGAAS